MPARYFQRAGPSPLPVDTAGRPSVVEVDRTVSRSGSRHVGATTLTSFHLESRELLRTRPNPLTPGCYF